MVSEKVKKINIIGARVVILSLIGEIKIIRTKMESEEIKKREQTFQTNFCGGKQITLNKNDRIKENNPTKKSLEKELKVG